MIESARKPDRAGMPDKDDGYRYVKPGQRGAVIVATSQVVCGGVGARAAAFVLERLGYRVWMLPTVCMPWHPGHGAGTRITPDREQFSALVDDLTQASWLGDVRAVLTGYLGDAAQAPALARLIAAVRARNGSAVHLCDPVIGDNKRLYVADDVACAVRDTLVAGADFLTPNAFELGWLTGRQVDTEASTLAAARDTGANRVLVTSSPALRGASVATLLATRHAAIVAEHAELPKVPHGTGDILAALFLAHTLDGNNDEAALSRAVASTFEMAARSAKAGSEELLFAEFQHAIERPVAMVTTRRIAERSLRVR